MRAAAAMGSVAATALFLAGCSEHVASGEARDLVQERAVSVGNELAAGVFVDGPDGVRAGLARESFGHDVEIDSHDASVGIDDHFTSRPAGRGVMFGAGVSPGGCIFGLVAPGALDVQADGHLAEGGCLKPPGR